MLSKITINKLENQLPYNQKFFFAPHLDNSSNNFKEEKIKKRYFGKKNSKASISSVDQIKKPSSQASHDNEILYFSSWR